MDGLPTTVAEFEERFGTEEQCEDYLRAKRWARGFVCPKCGGTKAWALRARALDECAACGHQVSLTAGTMFEGTRKPLVFWFRVIAQFVVSKSGCSAMDLHRQHGLAYRTAWTWLHKIRATMDRVGTSRLTGTVQIDESYLGGEDPPERKGRSTAGKKTPVIAAVEELGNACGRVRLEFAGGASGEDLGGFIGRNVEPGATARTDGLAAYRKPLENHGCKHIVHVVGKKPKNAAKVLPHVHRVFALLRRLLLGTYQGSVSVTHLKAYLDEFVFRFNRRNSKNRYLLVDRVLDAAFRQPPTYAELVGRSEPQPMGST